MPNHCTLAERKLLQAFYHNGTLAIFATGHVPTPCHEVSIERALLPVEPPQFALVQCRGAEICNQAVTPYTVSRLFALGVYRPAILVTHAGGRDEVNVEHVREYTAQKDIQLLGDVPVPYVFPPSTARNAAGDSVATGYSRSFDFREAFLEAANALPAVDPAYPDEVTGLTVVEIGAEFGGIAAFRHLFVRVRRDVHPIAARRV